MPNRLPSPRSARLTAAALAAGLALSMTAARAQFVAERYHLTESERAELTAGRDHLQKTLDALEEQSRKTGKPAADRIPDARIYLDAVDRDLRQDLFFSARNANDARACLKEGEARADALGQGQAPWERRPGVAALG